MHSLYLTIFDQGDAILDSAVFLDNLRFETIDAAKCKSLAVDPYDGLTGVSPVAGNPPKLSKDKSTLTFPVSLQPASRPGLVQRDRRRGLHPDPGSRSRPVVTPRSPPSRPWRPAPRRSRRTPPAPS